MTFNNLENTGYFAVTVFRVFQLHEQRNCLKTEKHCGIGMLPSWAGRNKTTHTYC